MEPAPRNVAAVGNAIRYVGGGYWGAWSGPITTNAGTETIFEFENPETLSAKISWATDLSTLGAGDLINIIITFNDLIVFRYKSKNEAGRAFMDIDPMYLIIPGNQTLFKMTIYTQTGADTISTFNLIGKEV